MLFRSFVYVRRGQAAPPLTPLYQGPYPVAFRTPKAFTIDLGGRQEVVSVDRLKPHLGLAPVDPSLGGGHVAAMSCERDESRPKKSANCLS